MTQRKSDTVKMFGMIVPKPGLSLQEFHDHYRHPHGTWGRRVARQKAYVQAHQIDTHLLLPQQRRFGAVAEVWLDSIDDFEHMQEDPMMRAHLIEDNTRFVDLDHSMALLTREEVIASGPERARPLNPGDDMWSPDDRPTSIKLLQFVPVGGSFGMDGADEHTLGQLIGALRHVRCNQVVTSSTHGAAPSQFAAVRELWWPTVTAFERGVSNAPDAWAKLIVDRTIHSMLMCAERFI